jgi:hypothetical protein
MVLEHTPSTRASRSRRQRALWPIIVAIMIVVGATGGVLMAAHH